MFRPLCALVAVALAACTAAPTPTATPDRTAGSFTAAGGSAALSITKALTVAYTKAHPATTFDLQTVSSEESVVNVANGDADLGFISRDLKNEEAGKVQLLRVGIAGTAVAVNAANAVTGLTKQQVRDIFSGKILDWKDAGGTPGDIKVFVREATSSTRQTFETYFFDGKPTYSSNVTEVVESGDTIKAIGSFKGAIGMVTLSQSTLGDKTLKLTAIDAIPASIDSLQTDKWPIRRPTYLIFTPDQSKLKPGVRAFLDWVKGPDGQKVISSF